MLSYEWMSKIQATLYDDLKLLFSPAVIPTAPGWRAIPLDFVTVEKVDKGPGRRELRRLRVSSFLNNAVCGLAAKARMPNLAALQRSLAAAFDRLLFRR